MTTNAKRTRRVVSAYVAQKNTPETDAMPVVPCVVHGIDEATGEKWVVLVTAACPMTAMDKVAAMDDARFGKLPAPEPHQVR